MTMDIRTATADFERWMGVFTPLDAADLRYKHAQMSEDFFRFFRGTYYRWAQIWADVCPREAKAPAVLGVGDLHVENFGTWRDIEGRLVWGINDFDEAYTLPYTNDLIRLAASGIIALKSCSLQIKSRDLCELILQGYREGITQGGRAFVLEENHPTLRTLAHNRLRDPAVFWPRFIDNLKKRPPETAAEPLDILKDHWPGNPSVPAMRYRPRVGMGSLGKPRFTIVGLHAGGWIAREAKALTPSACAWAKGSTEKTIHYQQIIDNAVRCADPFTRFVNGWLVRRLAADCSRIELATLQEVNDESHLLHAMGWETANIHLNATGNAKRILKDLNKRRDGWLKKAAKAMVQACRENWKDWRRTA
jgi:hypothetical protein